MTPHNEARADEIFVGNTDRGSDRIAELQTAGMRTARLGKVAYCIEGKRLSNTWLPLLIGRSEEALYDDIMNKRVFGPDWRRNR